MCTIPRFDLHLDPASCSSVPLISVWEESTASASFSERNSVSGPHACGSLAPEGPAGRRQGASPAHPGGRPKPRPWVLTRGPRGGCPRRGRIHPTPLPVRRTPQSGLRCGAAPGLGDSVSGRGPRPVDGEQSRQAVGRLLGRRRSWASTMAAAVRAAGFLPALCGASAGESWDPGSRSFEPSGSGGGGGSPGACIRPGGKKQEAAAPGSSRRFTGSLGSAV